MASGDLAGQGRKKGGLGAIGEGDPLFWNKVSGAVLGACLLGLGLNVFSGILYTPRKPAVTGYDLPAPEAQGAAGSDQQAQAEPLPVLLASADAGRGQNAVKKCAACHAFEKGAPNKIGPGLYGVVGQPKAAHPGFAYSAALKSKGGQWTYEDLDHFLANPKGYVPGTIMAFAGVSNPKERADILAYLRNQSESPVAFPEAPATPAAAPAAAGAPAAGGAPGPAQTEQRPSPAMPGQRPEPAPAPVQATPQPAAPQVQPTTPNQPQPPASGASPTQTQPTGSGSPTAAPSNEPAAAQPVQPSQTPPHTSGPGHQ